MFAAQPILNMTRTLPESGPGSGWLAALLLLLLLLLSNHTCSTSCFGSIYLQASTSSFNGSKQA
jgi:hypothetical protein